MFEKYVKDKKKKIQKNLNEENCKTYRNYKKKQP